MKRSTKASLLPAFVFPVAGHLYLKKYIPGVALIVASLVSIYYLITKLVESALEIAERIQSGEVQLDATTISELVSKQTTGTESQLINIATIAIIICWIVGIIDSYRVGRVRDNNKL